VCGWNHYILSVYVNLYNCTDNISVSTIRPYRKGLPCQGSKFFHGDARPRPTAGAPYRLVCEHGEGCSVPAGRVGAAEELVIERDVLLAVLRGLGRIAALYDCSSTVYLNRKRIRCHYS
jgi:hypothetical protein